jgi:hypothetical protein
MPEPRRRATVGFRTTLSDGRLVVASEGRRTWEVTVFRGVAGEIEARTRAATLSKALAGAGVPAGSELLRDQLDRLAAALKGEDGG